MKSKKSLLEDLEDMLKQDEDALETLDERCVAMETFDFLYAGYEGRIKRLKLQIKSLKLKEKKNG